MGELYQQYEELVEAGYVTESFEDWYSGMIDYYHDRSENR